MQGKEEMDVYLDEEVFRAPVRVWLDDGLAISPTEAEIEEALIEFQAQRRMRLEQHPLVLQ